MTPIKRNLNYQFTDFPLRLRIKWGGNISVTISTGYHVDKLDSRGREKWQNNRCKPNTTHGSNKTPASVINAVLEDLENRIDKAFLKYESIDQIPTRQQIYDELRPEKAIRDIWAMFDDFISEGEKLHQWSFNTVRSVKNIKALLKLSNPSLTANNISVDALNEFVAYQQTHRVSHNKNKAEQKGYANNVIQKNCRILKWFLKWAAEKNLIDGSLQYRFNPDIKSIKKDVIYLEWEELRKLEDYDFGERIEEDKARDFFCFCCFTSLRYSDAFALKKTDIKDDVIVLVAQKTATNLRIELNNHAKRILEKYKGVDSEYVLPRMKLAWLNQLLKKIGKELKFNTPVTISQFYGKERISRTVPKHELLASHCARRTFISNAIEMGIPPHVVMKWSGHTTMEALKPYLEIADRKKSEEMSKFDSK